MEIPLARLVRRFGEAFASNEAEHTPVREHRTAAKTKPNPEIGAAAAAGKADSARGVLPGAMRRLLPPDPYVEAKLLGILLSGVFGQTPAKSAR